MHARAEELIAELGLRPHPEGGYFREIFRSTQNVQPQDGRSMRTALTTIYFLLPANACSRWHAVSSDEVWHLYEGGPVELRIADTNVAHVAVMHLRAASRTTHPVATVPAGHWQAARALGDYALMGCTVGPGFEFADFRFMRETPQAARLSHRDDLALL